MTKNTAKKTKPEPKTKKSIFSLSKKDLKMVHGGKGSVIRFW